MVLHFSITLPVQAGLHALEVQVGKHLNLNGGEFLVLRKHFSQAAETVGIRKDIKTQLEAGAGIE
jgi:hypothetical protein